MDGLMLILAQADRSAAGGKSLLEFLRAGGTIGLVIVLLSFVALTLIVIHAMKLRPERLAPPETVERLRALMREHEIAGALRYCEQPENDSVLARLFASALRRCTRSPFGFLEMRSALEEAGQEQVSRLYRSLDGIGLIASVAPMLGLLGTVVGMVLAFDTVATAQGAARPDQLAQYISLALVTTVMGLVVAIPCVAVFTFFRNKIDRLSGSLAAIAEELSGEIESAAAPPARAPARGSPAPGTARPPHGPTREVRTA